jgi:Skp family chaperone for outer membrane proteins
MIDGIKAILRDNLDYIRNNPNLDFLIPSSITTGEIRTDKYPVAIYKGLKFIDKGSYIEIRGSIHKFYNDGQHNYNEFGIKELTIALHRLSAIFNIDFHQVRLVNLEIGINLNLSYNPIDFLNSIINHRGIRFSFHLSKNMEYRECAHCQFYIKIYNKGLQYSYPGYLLRVEVKFIKMEKPNNFGIKYLSDLLDTAKLHKLKYELIRIYDEILIGDIKLNPKGLSRRDEELFNKGHNPNFWTNLSPNTSDYDRGASSSDYKRERKKYERKLARFNHFLKSTGAISRKIAIKTLMEEKSSTLINAQQEIICDGKLSEKRGKLTESKRHKQKNYNSKYNKKTGEIDPLLYSVIYSHVSKEKRRVCKVTGLDISMQKEDSEFLCTTGIKYYKRNDPEIWLELWKRLSSRWYGYSEETQIEEIHHSIRNEYFNKIHNTKKSIQRITRHPALFNQMELISKDKLKLAAMAG